MIKKSKNYLKQVGIWGKASILFILLFIVFFFLTNLLFLDNLRFSIEGLFTGLLALTGFIFTARTFITFKLNEVVYGNPKYQQYVEKLQKEGHNKKLYAPLRKLDDNLGVITYMSLSCLFLTLLLAFFPEMKDVAFPSTFQPKYVSDFFWSIEGWQQLWYNNLIYKVLIQKFYSSLVAAYLLLTIIKLLQAVGSMNRNISAIIDHWEDSYNNTRNCP